MDLSFTLQDYKQIATMRLRDNINNYNKNSILFNYLTIIYN